MEHVDPCITCNPLRMAKEGCCSNDVGFGLKIIKKGPRRISVCKMLTEFEGGSWGCGVIGDGSRPPECASFSCFRKINSSW